MPTPSEILSAVSDQDLVAALLTRIELKTANLDRAADLVVAERALRVKAEKALAAYQATQGGTVPSVPVEDVPVTGGVPAVERNGTRVPIAPNLSASSVTLGPQKVASGQSKDFGGALLAGLNIQPGGIARNFRFKSDGALKVEDDGTIEDFQILDGSKYGIEGAGRLTIRRGIIGDVSQHSLIFGDCLWFKIEDLDIGSSLYQSSIRHARADGYFLRVRIRATTTKSTMRGGTLSKGVYVIDCDIEGAGTYGEGNPLGQRDGGDGRGNKEFNTKGGGVRYAPDTLWQAAYDKAKATGGTREQQVAAAAAVCGIGNVDIAKTLAVRDALLSEYGNAYHINTRIKVPLIAIEAGGMMDFDVRPESPIQFSRSTYPEWKLIGDPMRRLPQLRVAGKVVAL